MGCDSLTGNIEVNHSLFQSTHPSGVRPGHTRRPAGHHNDFNPRTPVGCDGLVCWVISLITDFNPRTPVGCDDGFGIPIGQCGISIHAPQWGATGHRLPHHRRHEISIHAPQWGATMRRWYSGDASLHFNPRTPVGCDNGKRKAGPERAISIHAPQWGATAAGASQRIPRNISIHAPQWGATLSLLRRGMQLPISIHAPQWGATTSQRRLLPDL